MKAKGFTTERPKHPRSTAEIGMYVVSVVVGTVDVESVVTVVTVVEEVVVKDDVQVLLLVAVNVTDVAVDVVADLVVVVVVVVVVRS